jgi:pyruvate formate lyase activating enzyme
MALVKRRWNRREFLGTTASCGALLGAGALLPAQRWLASLAGDVAAAAPADALAALLREAPLARYWVAASRATRDQCAICHTPGSLPAAAAPRHAHEVIRCQLCARDCTLAEGERGMCRARMHVHGELRSLVYGRPITVHVDPIEKKPFYHFLPGTSAYSLATSGCPLRCKFCQNWEISQASPEDYQQGRVAPADVAAAAVARDAPVIAFTYNEPTVFIEYLTDIARAARPRGRRLVLVSCGYMHEAPLAELCLVLDAIKIDLKGASEPFYRDVCGATLQPVLRSIRQVAKSGRHLEIVNLVVPTLNDSETMLTELAKWIAGEIGPDVPVHFTRFHPDYQLPNLPPTPVATLERARAIAMQAGIHYAYVGNVPGHPGNHTYCPKCGKTVIERDGFLIAALHLQNGRCEYCNNPIPGVWV